MFRTGSIAVFAASAVLLFPADPAWKTKPVQQWDEQDAKQVLSDSPWVKRAVVAVLPELTAQQRRDGGTTGGGRGVGMKGLNGGVAQPAKQVAPITIRWESAFPVRAAELKAREIGAPDWEGDAYVLAVYDVPDLKVGSNTKLLAIELKQAAVLKRAGKKDTHPSNVELMQQQNGFSTVVYVFPRSEEITLGDERIEFDAQLNRLSLAQYFFPSAMEFDGKLQL
jgi:hypothetical protein